MTYEEYKSIKVGDRVRWVLSEPDDPCPCATIIKWDRSSEGGRIVRFDDGIEHAMSDMDAQFFELVRKEV